MAGTSQQLKDVGAQIGQARQNIWGTMAPKYSGFQQTAENLRTAARPDTELARGAYKGMMATPGYSPDALNKMYGRSADVARGEGANLERGLQKTAASSGLSNTGAMMRNVGVASKQRGGQLIGAQRDIDLQNELQKKQDIWQGAQGIMGVQGSEDAWQKAMMDAALSGIGAENQFYSGTIMPSYSQQTQAYQAAHQPGFWGQLGSSLASGIGSAAGRLMAP
jgi:hypothetical protein